LREQRQELLKLVMVDGRKGGEPSGWADPSPPSGEGEEPEWEAGGQDRGAGGQRRWADLGDDDSDGAASDYGVGRTKDRRAGVSEDCHSPTSMMTRPC
jgi:hypothetical protein